MPVIILTVNQKSDNTKLELTTVSNILNALGAHEYRGHGINHYRDKNHHKAYEEQFNDKSWVNTTMIFKYRAYYRYLKYLKLEGQSQQKINAANRLMNSFKE